MSGRYWFPKHYSDVVQRLRVPLGFVMLVAFLWFAAPDRWSLLAGLPLAAAGVAVRAWAAGHLAKNETLAISGPYRWIRNPLYLGTLSAAAGFAIAARRPGLVVLFIAVFVLVYLPAIELEEQKLRALFPDYATYASYVPMIVPRGPKINADGSFRWQLYRKNEEYNALAGFAAGVLYLLWRAGILGL
ncbi:MAG: isoprenylcysteine carboxylmethyltransferase family protein [Acidobacteria bacterium]|nr:isoprenylcysteine carboxylmethyltransferase family protein [Acidobacteriota bacterium]